jgi:hypothetical protein
MGLESTTCCIAGGGPAGMMLGFLLARAGVEVIVLEKHADFLRDFRGDTIHPSTMQVMHELGLLDEFLRLPHVREDDLVARFGAEDITVADFSHLPVKAPFIAFMPQWDFLDFLADHGRAYPNFRLLMRTKATGLVEESGCVVGVTAESLDGLLEIRADLVVAADGRRSDVRAAAGFAVTELGAPMDVLWFRLSRRPDEPAQAFGQVAAGADLHRRCRARDVADRRRRHQPGDPGCGRHRQPAGAAVTRENADGCRSRRRSEAAGMACQGYTGSANRDPEPGDHAAPRGRQAGRAALAAPAAAALPAAAPATGADGRHGRPPGACRAGAEGTAAN